MSQIEKLLLKFITNPESLRFSEIKKILEMYGYEERQGKGSHTVFKNSQGNVLTIPIHNNDCKDIYKRKIKKIIFK